MVVLTMRAGKLSQKMPKNVSKKLDVAIRIDGDFQGYRGLSRSPYYRASERPKGSASVGASHQSEGLGTAGIYQFFMSENDEMGFSTQTLVQPA